MLVGFLVLLWFGFGYFYGREVGVLVMLWCMLVLLWFGGVLWVFSWLFELFFCICWLCGV